MSIGLFIFIIFALTVLGTLIFIISSFLILLLERGRKYRESFDNISKQLWLSMMFKELWSMLAILWLRPFVMFQDQLFQTKNVGIAKGFPVFFIHGYGMINHPLGFLYIKRKLSQKGFGPFLSAHLDTVHLPVSALADQVIHIIREKLSSQEEKRIHLVCHSLGGIIAREILSRKDIGFEIQSVVTIGSAHLGTKIAYAGSGLTARQLEPKSEYLKQLASLPITQPHFSAIYSEHDNLALTFPGKVWNPSSVESVFVKYTGHTALLFSNEIAQLVTNSLENSWLSHSKEHSKCEHKEWNPIENSFEYFDDDESYHGVSPTIRHA